MQDPTLIALFDRYEALCDVPRQDLTPDDFASLRFYKAEAISSDADSAKRSSRIQTWLDRAKQLEAYIDREGRMPRENNRLPAGLVGPEESQLVNWVRYQRKSRAADILCEYQILRLELVTGFDWAPFDTQWDQEYTRYRAHLEHFRGAPKFRSEDPNEVALAKWASRQRAKYRTGNLDAERTYDLEALPIWTWGPNPTGKTRSAVAGLRPLPCGRAASDRTLN
jgi:hypothetical protein